MQVYFEFKDSRGEHAYYYDLPAVPRVGEYFQLPKEWSWQHRRVRQVTWHGSVPFVKLGHVRNK